MVLQRAFVVGVIAKFLANVSLAQKHAWRAPVQALLCSGTSRKRTWQDRTQAVIILACTYSSYSACLRFFSDISRSMRSK